MRSLAAHLDDIQRRLDALARQHDVPGAALAVSRGDELLEFATGVISTRTGVAATTDTVFQIGSNTKLMTTTLIMQLVEAGRADLDAPVRRYVPSLELAEPEVAGQITLRHLLTHTSGIEGDYFAEFGRGDDATARYVRSLATVGLIHRPGQLWSYCNAGFVIAGRVIEKLTGLTWDAALREKLYRPLGLTHTVTLAEEALLFRTAAGHVDVTGDPVLAPVWQPPRSIGPAGMICSTPAEVLAFARMHLAGGLAPDGTRVLSAESAAAMTRLEAELPDKIVTDACDEVSENGPV